MSLKFHQKSEIKKVVEVDIDKQWLRLMTKGMVWSTPKFSLNHEVRGTLVTFWMEYKDQGSSYEYLNLLHDISFRSTVSANQQDFLKHSILSFSIFSISDDDLQVMLSQSKILESEDFEIKETKNFKSTVRKSKFKIEVKLALYSSEFHPEPGSTEEVEEKIGSDEKLLQTFDRVGNEEFSDVVVTCGSKSFCCHKIILAKWSEVFSAMFKHQFEENNNGEIVIKDFDVETVESLINFMYDCQLPKSKFTLELLMMADKYNVIELKKLCQTSIAKGLNNENVMDVLSTSSACQALGLKFAALDYIIANWDSKSEFINYDEILDDHPSLLKELLSMLKPI